jgi:hypothetical protein
VTLGLTFTDAYFESMSALTATGATLLSGLDDIAPSINIWRAELQWLGGMGVIVLVVAVLPMIGVGGRQITKAEIPGPMKDDQLTPRMTQTAKGLWIVYFALTFACFVAYKVAGMSWLDALIHSFTTLSLGGFSSHDGSIGYFDAVAIELVAHGDARSSKVVGRRVEELDLPKGATIGTIVRRHAREAAPHSDGKPVYDYQVLMAHHDVVIEPDDHVIVFVVNKRTVPKVEKLFQVNVSFL